VTDRRGSSASDAAGAGDAAGAAGAIVWFTGLPSSGKTTLARRVQAHFGRTGRVSVLLDSDELRDLLGAHSYAPEDRAQFYRQLAALAVLLARQGLVVLVAATAPRREDRDRARGEVGAGRFNEVWVDTPLADCEARDPKGLYAQARRGDASELPGVGAEYEPPWAPEVIADGGVDDAAVAAIECRLDTPPG
jgi:adenylylsulfate kinase